MRSSPAWRAGALEVFSLPAASDPYAAIRALAADRLGVGPARIAFGREPCPVCGGPTGRPNLTPGGVEFSLSRAPGKLLIVLADRAVGVDVEEVPAGAVAEEVAALLHPAERASIGSAEDFAQLWTRKEALLKAIGTGIAHGLGDVRVDSGDPPGWRLLDLEVGERYRAAIAVAASAPSLSSAA